MQRLEGVKTWLLSFLILEKVKSFRAFLKREILHCFGVLWLRYWLGFCSVPSDFAGRIAQWLRWQNWKRKTQREFKRLFKKEWRWDQFSFWVRHCYCRTSLFYRCETTEWKAHFQNQKQTFLSLEVWTLTDGWGRSPRLLGLSWEENQLVTQGNQGEESSSDKWGPQDPPPLVNQELTVSVGNGAPCLRALPLFSMVFIFVREYLSNRLLLTFNRDDRSISISKWTLRFQTQNQKCSFCGSEPFMVNWLFLRVTYGPVKKKHKTNADVLFKWND